MDVDAATSSSEHHHHGATSETKMMIMTEVRQKKLIELNCQVVCSVCCYAIQQLVEVSTYEDFFFYSSA